MTSGFHREGGGGGGGGEEEEEEEEEEDDDDDDEEEEEEEAICALLLYYEAYGDNSLRTFWDNLSVPSPRVKKSWLLNLEPTMCTFECMYTTHVYELLR